MRIEAQAWGDWRFAALANALGIDRYSALARCAYLWGVCTTSGSYFVLPAVCGAILERPPAEAVAALVGACLAEETPEGVRPLSSSTRKRPVSSRTMSVPQMWM